jgi:nucleotide-binding universal stress UspA family protein
MGKIVVGFDGSKGSAKALCWAIDEAALRGDSIVALAGWAYQTIGFGDVFVPPIPVEDQSAGIRAHVDSVLAGIDRKGVDIEVIVSEGNPSTLLLEASADADMLVVGARGAGGFMGLLLGSVARQVTSHAVCPTVVLPHSD